MTRVTLPAAILAGGLATRLGALASGRPKALVEVAGRPFAAHQLALLRRHGVSDIVFCVGHLGDQLKAALGDGRDWGLRLRYVHDGPRLLGTGGALRRALPFLGPAFFVLYGDSYLDCNYAAVESAFWAAGRRGLMTVFHNRNRWDASNVHLQAGRIVAYDKRRRTPAMEHIDYGLGVLRAEALEAYPAGTHFDLAEVYQDLLRAGELAAFEVSQRFYEIGSPAGLDETRRYLESLRADPHELRKTTSG